MMLHAFDARHAFGGNADGALFLFRLDDAPKMHDPVLDEHTLFRQPPALPVHFPDDRVAQARIVVRSRVNGWRGAGTGRSGLRPCQVKSRDVV